MAFRTSRRGSSTRFPAAAVAAAIAVAVAGCLAASGGPPPPPERPGGGGAPAVPEIGTACDRAEAERSEAVTLEIAGWRGRGVPAPVEEALAPFERCVEAGRGVWMLRLDELSIDAGDPEREWNAAWSIRGMWHLAHCDPTGCARSQTPPRAREPAGDPLGEQYGGNLAYAGYRDGMNFEESGRVLGTFDYDGDGSAEIVLETWWDDPRTTGAAATMWTRRGDRVEPYGPAEGIAFESIRDVDGDGRPDLASGALYLREGCGRYARRRVGGPAVTFHSLPGGTFTDSDEAAAEALREQCPAPPEKLLVSDGHAVFDPDDWLRNIACARLWGASAEETTARIRVELPPFLDEHVPQFLDGEPCFDDSILLEQAGIEPPVLLAPRAGPR